MEFLAVQCLTGQNTFERRMVDFQETLRLQRNFPLYGQNKIRFIYFLYVLRLVCMHVMYICVAVRNSQCYLGA